MIKRIKSVFREALSRVVPSFGATILLFAILGTAKMLEPTVLPVATDFKVLKLSYLKDEVEISGTINKRRSCTLVSMDVYAIYQDASIPNSMIEYSSDTKNRTKSVGFQEWGPWSLAVPTSPSVRRIDITANYRCHNLWDTSQDLIKFLLVPGVEINMPNAGNKEKNV